MAQAAKRIENSRYRVVRCKGTACLEVRLTNARGQSHLFSLQSEFLAFAVEGGLINSKNLRGLAKIRDAFQHFPDV